MRMEVEMISKVLWLILTVILGMLTYFLKKTDQRVDGNTKEIVEIRSHYATKQELKEAERKLECAIKESNGNIMKKLEKIEDKLSGVNEMNVSKTEFLSALTRLDGKIDRLTDLFLEQK